MRSILGLLSVLIALYSYIPYYRDVQAGTTKPHTFSWLIWTVLTALVFVTQVQESGGPGAWALGISCVLSTGVLLLSLKKGERHIYLSDWICLVGAGVAIGLWLFAETPLYSVLLATLIAMIGFVPTFRKSYHKPHEETVAVYSLSVIKFMLSIAAMNERSLINVIYPLSAIVVSSALVLMIAGRKKRLPALPPL